MARLFADENFPRPVVEGLRAAGHDVVTIQEIGEARVGDKTLVDALAPASAAFDAALAAGRPFAECLARMAAAAEQGRDSTRDLVARVGRASRLGERSRGVLDAGATSCALLLQSTARSLEKALKSS